jgi:fibronectin-binding autotransporter adhesin
VVGNELLTLTGAAVGSGAVGANGLPVSLDIAAGTNAWGGNVSLVNAASAGGVVVANVAAGASLALAGAVGQTGLIPVGLTLTGTGTTTVEGSAANTYAGTTTVVAGTLVLNKSAGVTAVAGSLMIGDAAAGTGATVRYAAGAADQIADSASVGVLFNSTLT